MGVHPPIAAVWTLLAAVVLVVASAILHTGFVIAGWRYTLLGGCAILVVGALGGLVVSRGDVSHLLKDR